jgi:heme/copper-type cytochrome/quinol oxidase subunit 2
MNRGEAVIFLIIVVLFIEAVYCIWEYRKEKKEWEE